MRYFYVVLFSLLLKFSYAQWIDKELAGGYPVDPNNCRVDNLDGYESWYSTLKMINDSTGYRLSNQSYAVHYHATRWNLICNYGFDTITPSNWNNCNTYGFGLTPNEVALHTSQMLNDYTIFTLETTPSFLSLKNQSGYIIQVEPQYNQYITSYYFLNSTNGFINVTNNDTSYLLKYINGNNDTIFSLPNSLSSNIEFFGDSLGFMTIQDLGTNNIQLHKTSDIGQNWVNVFDSLPSPLKGFDFISDSIGFLVLTNNHIYKTTDRGNSWIFVSIDYNRFKGVYDFLTETNWYAVQNTDSLFKTYNAGLDWIYDSLTLNPIHDIEIRNDTLGYAISTNCHLYIKGGKTIFVSINELENNSDLLFYPNPVDDILYVKKTNSNIEVRILDINGKTLINEINSLEINTSYLPSGIYIVQLINNEKISNHKLIKR